MNSPDKDKVYEFRTEYKLLLMILKDGAVSREEKRLSSLFRVHADEIYEHFKHSFLENNAWLGDVACSRLEFFGPMFHKGFRQIDVVDTYGVDMIIWNLLKDSDFFWECIKDVFDDKLI